MALALVSSEQSLRFLTSLAHLFLEALQDDHGLQMLVGDANLLRSSAGLTSSQAPLINGVLEIIGLLMTFKLLGP